MNYTLFILITFLGIYSYIHTPQEIFPTFNLNKISIKGSYAGTSIDILDKIAVREIEDRVKGIEGINDMTSAITPGSFVIVLDLVKGVNEYDVANKIKDAVADAKQNFPDDMNDPRVTVISTIKPLLTLSISSSKKTLSELKDIADDIKTKILGIKDISDVTIYGNSDMYYNIVIDERKLDALHLNKSAFLTALANLSYIFPIGKIDGAGKHYYISTYNGAKTAKEMANSIISINGKKIYLKDVAKVEKKYEDSQTLSTINTKPSLNLAISQIEGGNAINGSKDIKKLVKSLEKEYKDITFTINNNTADRIKDRLNVVISNIFFGIILVTLLLAVMINPKMALLVGLGIPTSFVMAAIYFHAFGYTINMISLIGVLLALGILVDDAIVVAESIQQYIEKGFSPKEAAYRGSSEVAEPVIMASITTLFSFIPILMISGTMGEFIKLIPVAVSALLIASLIESFIFLPLHATHILDSKSKVISWERPSRIYNYIIHKFMTFRKTFLFLFLVIVPILTFMGIKSSRFQMFPKFDSTTMSISIKTDINTPIEETYKKANIIADALYKNRDKFFIKNISTTAGHRINAAQSAENYPYVASINIDLYKLKAQDFMNKYITPALSLYYDKKGRIRDKKSQVIAKEINRFFKEKEFKKKLKLQELFIEERRAGPVKADISIGIISNNTKETRETIKKIEGALSKLKGVKTITDNAHEGVDEIKIKINKYGEELGLSERSIGATLSNYFLDKKVSTALDSKNLLDIKVEGVNKDKISSLKNMKIDIGDGKMIALNEVADFIINRSFERVTKDFGVKTFYVYANVDPKIITASEALARIKPVLNEVQKSGIKLKFFGEKQKNNELKNDMLGASFVAFLLIILSLLYLFNSFRDAFIIASVIPFSFLGVLIGHQMMGLNLSMPSIIGALGLAGVVINDGILMVTYLQTTKTLEEFFIESSKRLRPIFLTSITTLIGLSTLIFFPIGQAVIFQPMAVALGFGLGWGTVLNLLYVPTLYAVLHKEKYKKGLEKY
jgi:multidrug efflux pump subunit AcrB